MRSSGSEPHSVIVVGGGLVGLGTALALLQRAPHLQLTLLDKEAGFGRHQSSHNSGVLHAGLYYQPGSAKARLAVAGIRSMRAFCAQHDIPHEITGKLVVAVTVEEVPRLQTLFEAARRMASKDFACSRPLKRSRSSHMFVASRPSMCPKKASSTLRRS